MQAVSPFLHFSFSVLVALSGASCKTTGEKVSEVAAVPLADASSMRIPVGTLHVVRADGNFVLVRTTRFLAIEPGTDLFAYGSAGVETARLRVSPARKGQFVTADIVSGKPMAGDQVLMDYVNPQQSGDAVPQAGAAGGGGDEIQVLE